MHSGGRGQRLESSRARHYAKRDPRGPFLRNGVSEGLDSNLPFESRPAKRVDARHRRRRCRPKGPSDQRSRCHTLGHKARQPPTAPKPTLVQPKVRVSGPTPRHNRPLGWPPPTRSPQAAGPTAAAGSSTSWLWFMICISTITRSSPVRARNSASWP